MQFKCLNTIKWQLEPVADNGAQYGKESVLQRTLTATHLFHNSRARVSNHFWCNSCFIRRRKKMRLTTSFPPHRSDQSVRSSCLAYCALALFLLLSLSLSLTHSFSL